MNARFTTTDRRFSSVVNRVGETEQRSRSLTERFDRQRGTVEGRFDAIDAQVDVVQEMAARQIDQAQRQMLRTLVVAMTVMTVVLPTVTCVVAWVWLT